MPFANDVLGVDQKFPISANTNGKRIILGNGSDHEMGGIAVHFVNGADVPTVSGATPFVGSLLVVGRLHNQATNVDGVPYVPVPFRASWLNGAAADPNVLQPANTLITDTSMFVVPSMAQMVGIEVTVASGTGYLYRVPLEGTVFP
jgi:hypothetical protein